MTSSPQSARAIRVVLDDCVERIAKVGPALQLAALKRILRRVSDLKTGLAASLSGITSGRKLASAIAEDDPSKRALALLVLTEVEPGLVAPIFDEIEAIAKRSRRSRSSGVCAHYVRRLPPRDPPQRWILGSGQAQEQRRFAREVDRGPYRVLTLVGIRRSLAGGPPTSCSRFKN